MQVYSSTDRAKIFGDRKETYRVNVMRHRYGDNYERTETRWFNAIESAHVFVADLGCDVAVDMGNEWFADDAFANHDASLVCLVVRR